jgi:hypothetical protein
VASSGIEHTTLQVILLALHCYQTSELVFFIERKTKFLKNIGIWQMSGYGLSDPGTVFGRGSNCSLRQLSAFH